MARKVEEQKGPLKVRESNYRTQSYADKVSEAKEQLASRRSYQTLTPHEPKTSRK